MKNEFAALGLLLCLALLIGGSASAQNYVKNPGFNDPMDPFGSSGTTNWVVAYVVGGPDDFAIHERTLWAARTFQGGPQGAFGVHFRPIHDGSMHAYVKQVVSGLVPGDTYIIHGYGVLTWGGMVGTDPTTAKIQGYIETRGGGDVSSPLLTTPATAPNPAAADWTFFSVTNTARLSGSIEIQLHFNKPNNTSAKAYESNVCFDDISLVHQ